MDFSGIEIHNPIINAVFTGKGGPLERYNTQATARALRDKGLCIPALDSSVDISAGKEQIQAAKDLIDLAAAAGVERVVVVAQNDDEDAIHAALAELVPYAEASDVVLSRSSRAVSSPAPRAWRASWTATPATISGNLVMSNNVYRTGGETPAQTVKNLGAYIKHVHMRDSDDDGSFNLVGEGTLPIDEVVRALSSIDYDGYVSLEWDPAWMPDLTDMEVIFLHLRTTWSAFEDTWRQAPHAHPQPSTTARASTCGRKTSSSGLDLPQVPDKMVECPDQYCF